MSVGIHNKPLLPHIGVCALVPDQWNTIWQPRHYVLTRLAHYFHVVWISPAPDWRGMFNLSANHDSHEGNTLCPPGLIVYEPELWLPKFYRVKPLAQYAFNIRLQRARRLLTSRGCHKIILYIWRPEFAPAMTSIPFDSSCYHIDDDYSFSEFEVPLDPVEGTLIAKVDQVFIHSPGLMEKKGTINLHTAFIPNGVDFFAYANAAPEPRDLSVIPRPRIGYTGFIKKQLDWDLLLELTRRHREWSFVFVGPRSPHPEIEPTLRELSSYRNVHFLEAKPSRVLAEYPQHFDTCIMPYRVNAYTNNIYPLKLHEYFASGRPIVSAPIRSLRDFSQVIALANGLEEWSNALTRTLEPAAASADAVAARREIARQYDWDKLVHVIAQKLCERLGSKYAGQFASLNIPDNRVSHSKHDETLDPEARLSLPESKIV